MSFLNALGRDVEIVIRRPDPGASREFMSQQREARSSITIHQSLNHH